MRGRPSRPVRWGEENCSFEAIPPTQWLLVAAALLAASAPRHLAGQTTAVSRFLPVRAQRPSPRQGPARRPRLRPGRMRHLTTPEPEKSEYRFLRRTQFSRETLSCQIVPQPLPAPHDKAQPPMAHRSLWWIIPGDGNDAAGP